MKRLAVAAALVLLSLVPMTLRAWTLDEANRTVMQVGTHVTSTGFVILVGGIHANCQFGALYFDVSRPLGKAILATLTVAKATGQPVRIGYSPPASPGVCTLELAALG